MKRRRLYSGRSNCVNEQSFTDFCPTQRINRPIVREEQGCASASAAFGSEEGHASRR
jgi:hypothetical protein